jgi:lipopolysaccharide/colanic/teichoic acid biosynthesis glycosyltransferase
MKRLIDFLVSFFALVFAIPLIVVIIVAIRVCLGSPILFTQVRPGLHGKPFKMFKFRTMTLKYNKKGELLPDAMRINYLGSLLRSASLDELPNLWNVLVGHMSLVGPRPLLMEYLPLYNAEQSKRHHVKPGITGWAQVNGRNAISWEDKFALDVWYANNQSFFFDLKIILMTIKKVLLRSGISAQGEATMPKFTGSGK